MKMAETEKMVYIVTHAGEDPERATFPFMLATAAQAMEVEVVVALQGVSWSTLWPLVYPPLRTWSTLTLRPEASYSSALPASEIETLKNLT
jgi:hypothetical protein